MKKLMLTLAAVMLIGKAAMAQDDNKKEKFNIAPSDVEKYISQYFNEHNLSKEKYREIIKILY